MLLWSYRIWKKNRIWISRARKCESCQKGIMEMVLILSPGKNIFFCISSKLTLTQPADSAESSPGEREKIVNSFKKCLVDTFSLYTQGYCRPWHFILCSRKIRFGQDYPVRLGTRFYFCFIWTLCKRALKYNMK